MRGYFGIGVYHGKTEHNLGTLLRSSYQLGASFVFTIGERYRRQSSDTIKTWKHIPIYNYEDWDDFHKHIPYSCPVIAVEMGGIDLPRFYHPERCIYLLGAEDHGLPPNVTERCVNTVSLPSVRTDSYNVAVAGSLVMFHRLIQKEQCRP